MELSSIFLSAALYYGVSEKLLRAIALVESGLHPYAVNVNGRSFYPETPQEALELIKGAKNYDIGIMQINSFWLKKLGISPKEAIDVRMNVYIGAYVLRYCMNLFSNSWKAVECYHRGELKAETSSSYAQKVCSVLYGKELCKF